jgi:hypothetical protein
MKQDWTGRIELQNKERRQGQTKNEVMRLREGGSSKLAELRQGGEPHLVSPYKEEKKFGSLS